MLTIIKYLLTFAVLVLMRVDIAYCADMKSTNFTDFYRTLETGADEQAVRLGQKIFNWIEEKYQGDTGFGALKSKMNAADFLANQMINQLNKATGKQIFAVSGELFEDNKIINRNALSVAPAKSFYETSQQIFSRPVNVSQFSDEEKLFLAKFYDLKLRILTSAIAKAGKALAISEPSFKGTYDYVLVLPLLHASETNPININILPFWMRQSNQLHIFSDSCLLHFGLAYHAQAFAKVADELNDKVFSEEIFYLSASKRCVKQLPGVAVDCIKRAINSIDEQNIDEKINLQFDIVQIWLDSDNFALAAGEAKSIADNFPDHKRHNEATWLHFYALSRSNNVKAILANIDTTINDSRCAEYRSKLMYIKWYALCRQKDNIAQVAALEHKLITDYGEDMIIAPILLSRATDLLARQDYAGACLLLDRIREKFPTTKAAEQANKIAAKLKALRGSK